MLTGVHVYPVKSLAGVDVPEAGVEPWGLRHDRRWLLLDPDGTALTARRRRPMLALSARPHDSGAITLRDAVGAEQRVEPPVGSEAAPTSTSRLESVRVAAEDANGWLSRRLGGPVRLGWLDDPRRRPVSSDHGGRPGDALSLADAGPLLLTSTASLRVVNEWMAEDATARGETAPHPMQMRRFRPNLVADLDVPFVEDGWARVRIGRVEFRVAERCSRCVMTTIDPESLAGGKEPIRTLARRRRHDRKTWFGIRLVPLSLGRVAVGEEVLGR